MTSGWKRGLPLALTTAVLWGVLPIALTVVLRSMDAYTVTWYRFVIAASMLLVVLGATRNLPPLGSLSGKAWSIIAIAVVGLGGNYVLFLLGLHYTSPTVTQVVSQLGPLFLMLAGIALFKEHLRGLQRWGVVALLAGLLLFFNRRLPELLHLASRLGFGVGLLVLGSIVWSVYGMSQKLLQRHLQPQQILLVVYLGSAIALLVLASPGEVTRLSSLQIALLAFCGINTFVAYGAFAESLKHWEVSRVGAVLATTPLFTLASMWIVGHLIPGFVQPEQVNALSILGALLVVAGSALCALGGGEPVTVAAFSQKSALPLAPSRRSAAIPVAGATAEARRPCGTRARSAARPRSRS